MADPTSPSETAGVLLADPELVGRYHLDHTNNVLAVARGDRKVWSHDQGGSTTGLLGISEEHDTKGVKIYRSHRDPDYRREVLWSCKWADVADILRPHLTGDILAECQAAGQARGAYLRSGSSPIGTPVEARCYAAAAAAWVAAEPAEQFALF